VLKLAVNVKVKTMPFPSVKKGNKRGEKAKQPRLGIPLTKTVSKETVKKLLIQEVGNISRCADIIGTCRGTLRRMIDNDEELKDTLHQCRERQLDELEKSCFERAIEEKDTTLQLFLLKTQGKSRGYDQNEAQNTAKDIATAAFDFIVNKSKEPSQHS
jgi:hypothetical protein